MSTLAAERVPVLQPISLEHLLQRGELLTRVDRKYVVPVVALPGILAAVADSALALEIDGRRSFGYRSTYFDTPQRDSFHISGRSHRRRWKVRTRTYLDSGSSWLEVKTRTARGRTFKQRIEHPDAMDNETLTPAGQSFLDGVIGVEVTACLEPVLNTGYRRTTLFLPASGSRVTLDLDLVWTSLTRDVKLDRPALAIVETKTGSTPSAVDRLMWSRGHRPVRISKFGVGMAALHPDLPRLKWHRAMHKHLDLPAPSDQETS